MRGNPPDAARSLLDRSFSTWPNWRCQASDPITGDVCGDAATWQRIPAASSSTAWTYCARHRPDDAEPIPGDAPFTVTRLELRVALCGAPGDRQASADDAVRRAVYALEGQGAVVTGLHVRGGKASPAVSSASVGRLQLAGRPEPAGVRHSRAIEAPASSSRGSWRHRRAG